MCKLSSSRLFRCTLCLILVCCLLVSWSPISAQASALPEVAGVVTEVIPFAKVVEPAAMGLGGSIFCWVAAALGIAFTAYNAVDAYNDFQDYSGMLETSIYYYPDGTWSYGVDMTFVESVRAFLFDSGIVVPYKAYGSYVSDDIVSHSYLDNGNLVTKEAIIRDAGSTVFSYRVCDNGKHYDLFYSASAFKVSYLGVTGALGKTVGDVSFYYVMKNYGVANRLDTNTGNCVPGDFTSVDLLLDVVAKLISSNGSFVEGSSTEIEYVAPLEVPMPEAYPEWYTNSRPTSDSDSDEDKKIILPIPLNPSADPETQIGTLTQPEIWQGTVADPYPDLDTNPDTGTDTDPDTGTDTDPDSPGAPSSDIGDYQIDLKKFFPFCIPFDLYDFFTCLNADPVAPVIEWVIPLPGGGTYPLEIDLSAFDGVAQLLRRLQLLLFCVGLAFKTRDLIKG